MQRKHMLFTILMIASLILSACATASTPTTVVTEEPAVEQPTEVPVVEQPTEAPPVEKKVVTFVWTQEFDTLSPIYTNMWFVSVVYPAYMCPAWLFDDQNTAFPYLVTEIPSIENGGFKRRPHLYA